MVTSGHTAPQRTDLQAKYTAAVAALPAAVAAGTGAVAAWLAGEAKQLQLVVTKEGGAPLS